MFVNIIREMVNFEFGEVIERVVFSRETSQTSLAVEYLWLSGRALELGNPKVRGSISIQFLMGLRIFSLCHARDKTKKRLSLLNLPIQQKKEVTHIQ